MFHKKHTVPEYNTFSSNTGDAIMETSAIKQTTKSKSILPALKKQMLTFPDKVGLPKCLSWKHLIYVKSCYGLSLRLLNFRVSHVPILLHFTRCEIHIRTALFSPLYGTYLIIANILIYQVRLLERLRPVFVGDSCVVELLFICISNLSTLAWKVVNHLVHNVFRIGFWLFFFQDFMILVCS